MVMHTEIRDNEVARLERILKSRVKRGQPRLLVPEAFSTKALDGVHRYLRDYKGFVVLLGDSAEIHASARAVGLSLESPSIEILDPEVSRERLPEIGTGLLQEGAASGMVAGAVFESSAVLGPAVKNLRRPGAWVSEAVVLVTLEGRAVVFADCAVIPDPDSNQLAAIASDVAATFRQLLGQDSRVAMLSYSTMAKSRDPRVLKVQKAVEIARGQDPHLLIDGEFQFDCAFDSVAAATKAPQSCVAGRANVFIFPDLSSANIGHKIAEYLGGATFLCVFATGLVRPVINVSRSATPQVIARCLAACAALATEAASSDPRGGVQVRGSL